MIKMVTTQGFRKLKQSPQPAAPVANSPAGIPLFLRSKAEASLGRSLDNVRIHTDAEAAESARSLGARAYTAGRDIVFAPGQYNPQTPEGQRLVAHELAHVVQQSGGETQPVVGPAGDAHEQSAHRAAGNITAGTPALIAAVAGAPTIQCEHEADWETLGKSADLTELAPSVQKLRNGALKLVTIANKLKKKGTGFIWDDKKMLASAYNLLDLAKALTDLASGADGVAGGSAASAGLAMASQTAKHARNLIAAVKLAADLLDDENALAFEADPTSVHKAAAWATQAADTFNDAGKLIDFIPDGLLPGFVKEFWKGLLRAPASYVTAFLAIMEAHIARIDAASGGKDVSAKVTGGWGGDWQGPLSAVYFRAPGDLREFMQSHRTRSGLDLFEAEESVGKGQLIAMVEREADLAVKARWIGLIEHLETESTSPRAH